MAAVEKVNVTTTEGVRGTIDANAWPLDGSRSEVLVRLEDGRALMAPVDLLMREDDGSYRLRLGGSGIRKIEDALAVAGGRQAVVPLVEERLLVGKREVETGRVVVSKTVLEEQQPVEQSLLRQDVLVERVPVGRVVDAPTANREEGETLVVPVFEEVLVIEKRLMLKEEVRITRRATEVRHRDQVTLRREVVQVDRVDGKSAEVGDAGTGVAGRTS